MILYDIQGSFQEIFIAWKSAITGISEFQKKKKFERHYTVGMYSNLTFTIRSF